MIKGSACAFVSREQKVDTPKSGLHRRNLLLGSALTAIAAAGAPVGGLKQARAQQVRPASTSRTPDILVIGGDDAGWHRPGSGLGPKAASPSLAEVMKGAGYRTGYFGKIRPGDRDEHLAALHGFDAFFANLYRPDTREELEQGGHKVLDHADSGRLKEKNEKKHGTRGVVHLFASDTDDPAVQPRIDLAGTRTTTDTGLAGPFARQRIEKFDETEVIPEALKFMRQSKSANVPFFVWLNTARMDLCARLSDKRHYVTEKHPCEADLRSLGMLDHDDDIGPVLDFLRSEDLDENTIVWHSTDALVVPALRDRTAL